MPNTTRPMPDQKIAPAHITQGSADEYSVAWASTARETLGLSWRTALVSAWPVQSPVSVVLQ
ncbi:hypothetical protein D3C71_1543600 [compost metagenome]